jgi:hypothetical protein
MEEALISACETLDAFGLPRAFGRFDADRFIFANRCFLDAIGIDRDEITGLAMSGILKIHLQSPEAARAGRLIPITVRPHNKQTVITGHAAFSTGEMDLIYLMLVLPTEPSAEVEAAMAAEREQKRQEIANYVHENIAPELLSVVFLIETIRLELGDRTGATATKLKELGNRLTKLIEPIVPRD